MFKSLIEQCKLFVKGATGKDRLQKHQLSQQLMRLQVAYDCIQENCDTLQQKNDALQKNTNQLKKKYSQLQRDHKELNALFNYADKENQELNAEVGKMRSHIKTIEADSAALQSQVIYLEHKLGLRAYEEPSSHSSSHVLGTSIQGSAQSANSKPLTKAPWTTDNDELDELKGLTIQAIVDLSDVSLALVGGHETTHREVAEELKKYGLKRCIHIPPHNRESNSRHQIRDKIGNCDLIVTITSYIDHSVSNCIKQLQDTQMLTGEVIRVHCHGKSGVVREVLQYFSN
jgi:DNA repair exonuclease SbcCD ATPase subunit